MERQWITLTGTINTGTVSRRRLNYPGWRCAMCGWTIGTQSQVPPEHKCPAPKQSYPLVECEGCKRPCKPWALQAVYSTVRARDLYCATCYGEWLAEVAGAVESQLEAFQKFYVDKVTFKGLGHGNVRAVGPDGIVMLVRAGFGGKHGYRLWLVPDAAVPTAKTVVLRSTGTPYAKVVAAMLLFIMHTGQDIRLPTGGKTAAEAMEGIGVDSVD